MPIRRAVARLAAAPLFTVCAVLSLAAGIAVTTAVYSVVDTLLLSDLGVANPDSLAFVVTPGGGRFRRADADLAIDVIGSGRAILSGPFEIVRSMGMGTLYLGGFTLLLSMVGLFGVQSHVVTYRTREFGVRMSLGATARQIQLMVMRDGYRPVTEGLALGIWGGFAARFLVRSYMDVDVAIFDGWMLLVTPIPLIVAAVCACYWPAIRAARVDPITALRHE